MSDRPRPPYPVQQQEPPGYLSPMNPRPDHGEESYRGSGRLEGKAAIITGGDSGIGRAVAIAFAREGADLVLSYLSEEEDAKDTARLVEEAGQKAILIPGDIRDVEHCMSIIEAAMQTLGKIDVLVNNAAYQMSYQKLEEITEEEFRLPFETNVFATFYLTKAALPYMKAGGSIINTTSINRDKPRATLVPYAASKAAIANLTGSLAKLLGERGIRVNCVAPGPIWTPLIPSTMSEDDVKNFGTDAPLGRAGQPAELAPIYVLLASDESSYMSGSLIPVTGGTPML